MARFPELPPSLPRRGNALTKACARGLLTLFGWRVTGELPDRPKLVAIVAPHTSNWDFYHGFSAYLTLQLDCTWFGKHTLFFWPLGVLARRFGGMAIDRTRSGNMVQATVEEYRRRERMCIAITPEGTRSKVAEWKLGFYRIAVEAGVPIVPVALDYSKREVTIMPTFHPAYLLRNPPAKKEVWQDMQEVVRKLGREIPKT